MPTGLAARRLDPVAHKVPGRLTPGPGSPDVLIGGMPAWRARVDRHQCRHGPGVVIAGSPTVLINGQSACRQGDMLVEGSSRLNAITGGCPSVIIGDVPGTDSDAFARGSMSERVEPRSRDPFETLHDAIERGAVDAIADDILAGNMAAAYWKAAIAGLKLTLLPSSMSEAAVTGILSIVGAGAAGKLAGKAGRFLSGVPLRRKGLELMATRFGTKIERQMAKRGWTKESVEATINAPHRRASTRDTRWKPNGTRARDPATAYINRDGSYVVRNDATGDIVQISDRTNPSWSSPF
ncbi:colicin E5-related ribonuclease [Jiella pelagia]|uniref:Colicin E5-related ribonuclease n=1 Tax=Jiella pelagia TaxID=2986949 RepID=A0ABY7C5C9_9HYPH|nr:colicin E5-related ribonuclease [Jiella pelagia]WAP70961.1 colicin E5-related ribonuclease [Jiella pelagia]